MPPFIEANYSYHITLSAENLCIYHSFAYFNGIKVKSKCDHDLKKCEYEYDSFTSFEIIKKKEKGWICAEGYKQMKNNDSNIKYLDIDYCKIP